MKPTMNNNFYIYQHVDPRTNLIRYIGKGKSRRAWNFSTRCGHHKNWLKQLKDAGLEPRVELIETDKTEEQAFELERLWIAACRSSFQPLTNLTDGGEGASGWVPSEETRKKMSEANFGRVFTEEHRKKLSENNARPMLGKTHSEATKLKMSEERRGEKHHYFGKALSEEHCRKLSQARRGEKHHYFGKTHSDETRKKMSENNVFRGPGRETARQKLSQVKLGKASSRRRAVIGVNLTTREERTFESATSAALYVNGDSSYVSACCRGKSKTCKGWSFKYIDPKNKP